MFSLILFLCCTFRHALTAIKELPPVKFVLLLARLHQQHGILHVSSVRRVVTCWSISSISLVKRIEESTVEDTMQSLKFPAALAVMRCLLLITLITFSSFFN